MKVYRVTMSYFDGDHDHGRYASPLFNTRDLAEQFRKMLCEVEERYDKKYWWTYGYYDADCGPEASQVIEIEIEESLPELGDAKEYLAVTYT